MSSRPSIAPVKLTEQLVSGSRHNASVEKEDPEQAQDESLSCRATSPANDEERNRSLFSIGHELQRESQLAMARFEETEIDGDDVQERSHSQLSSRSDPGPNHPATESNDTSPYRLRTLEQAFAELLQFKTSRAQAQLPQGPRCCSEHSPFSHGSLPWAQRGPPGFGAPSGSKPKRPHLLDWKPQSNPSLGELPSYTERSNEPNILGLSRQHTIRPLHPHLKFHLSHEKLACKVRQFSDKVWRKRVLQAKREWQRLLVDGAGMETPATEDACKVVTETDEDGGLDLTMTDQDEQEMNELEGTELRLPDREILRNIEDTQCKTAVLDEEDSKDDGFASWQWNLKLQQQDDGNYGFRQTIWCKWQSKEEADSQPKCAVKDDTASELFYTCPHHTIELWKPRFEEKIGHQSRVRYAYYEPTGHDLPPYEEKQGLSAEHQHIGACKLVLIMDQMVVSREGTTQAYADDNEADTDVEDFWLDDPAHQEGFGNLPRVPWHVDYDNWTTFVGTQESTFGFHQHKCEFCKSFTCLQFKRVYADKEQLDYYVEAEVTVDKALGSGLNLGDEEWIAVVTGQCRTRWEARLDLVRG